MPITAPIIFLLLGWSGPDSARPSADAKSPAYAVLQVKSGIEIVVKKDGELTGIRLSGIDTPRTGEGTSRVDRLNQMMHLRGLVTVGSKVHLVQEQGANAGTEGRLLAQVYRASDGLWVNRTMVEEGFATAWAKPAAEVLPVFQTAEKQARDAKRGMWGPDFLAKATQPAKHDRIPITRPQPKARRVPLPMRGGPPPLGMGLVPANPPPLGFDPNVTVVAPNTPYGTGFDLGYGPPVLVTPASFGSDQFGNRRDSAEQDRLYNLWLQQQQQNHERARQIAKDLGSAFQNQGQAGNPGGGGAPGQLGTPFNPAGNVNWGFPQGMSGGQDVGLAPTTSTGSSAVGNSQPGHGGGPPTKK
jgi:endonuclease YncB( thermonuclease family)